MLESLNFPHYEFKTRVVEGKLQIFDPVRRKYVFLNPEERVRQYVLRYLHEQLSVPLGVLAVEKKITVNGLTRRPDIVVYDRMGNPLMIVECKAPEVMLDERTVFQIAQYHHHLRSPFILLTNGIQHFIFNNRNEGKGMEMLASFLNYSEMCDAALR